MCCPTEKVKTRTCGRACTEGHPLGTLFFHTQCSQLVTVSPGRAWHCLLWPTERVKAGRRLLQVLGADSKGLPVSMPGSSQSCPPASLCWLKPPASVVLAVGLPEGSVLSEGDTWARTPPPHRFPGTGKQLGSSCWFLCLSAALSPCLGCAPLRASIQGAQQPHSLPSIPQCAWSHASSTGKWEPAINPLAGQWLQAGAGCWGGRMARRQLEQKPAMELEQPFSCVVSSPSPAHSPTASHRLIGPVVLLKDILYSVLTTVREHHDHLVAVGTGDVGLWGRHST